LDMPPLWVSSLLTVFLGAIHSTEYSFCMGILTPVNFFKPFNFFTNFNFNFNGSLQNDHSQRIFPTPFKTTILNGSFFPNFQNDPDKIDLLFFDQFQDKLPKPTSLNPKMSAIEISNVAASAPLEKKPRAPRKPTLPAKYQKFMTFGFSLLRSLQESGVLSDEALESSFSSQLKLFGALDDQTAFYQAFLDGCSAQTKVMKKFVADRNKPPRKTRAKKEQDPNAPKKERKPRSKKETTVVSDAAANVIAELTSAALAPEPSVPATETKPKAKPGRKPKAAPTPAPTPATTTTTADSDDDDDGETILTRETIVDGTPFLIDQHNNLYDPASHAFVRQI